MEHERWLVERFEAHRPHLRAVAGRMLGSTAEADDAVQEAWLRLSRNGAEGVRNLEGWLTTVVARVCLDTLRTRKSRRERSLKRDRSDQLLASTDESDPEREVLIVDSISFALLVVLESLSPQERVAFVLHDLFGVPFSEIAPIIERSPEATRQLASRARRRVQGGAIPGDDRMAHREVVEAFLAAARGGDLSGLLEILKSDVVARADEQAVRIGAAGEIYGAEEVAARVAGRATEVSLALVDGEIGVVWAPRGKPRVVLGFTIIDGKIGEIDVRADRDVLRRLDLVLLDD